jgi:hypothetical protein
LDVFREKMATTEADHVGQIMDVTLRRRPVADKQRHRDPQQAGELMVRRCRLTVQYQTPC